jgi:RNA polymerase sigma-70 factor (ECF subfamily)
LELVGYFFRVIIKDASMQYDAVLLNAVRRMEGQALAEIYDEYFPTLHKYVRRTCSDPHLADNIDGDVFARLLDQLSAGKGPNANLRSYLFTATQNLLVDQVRYLHRRAPLEVVDASLSDGLPAHLQSENRILLERIVQAIQDELTENQRQVITLRFLEGYSLRETAALLGKSVNRIKAAQNRAITTLRRCLEQWGMA